LVITRCNKENRVLILRPTFLIITLVDVKGGNSKKWVRQYLFQLAFFNLSFNYFSSRWIHRTTQIWEIHPAARAINQQISPFTIQINLLSIPTHLTGTLTPQTYHSFLIESQAALQLKQEQIHEIWDLFMNRDLTCFQECKISNKWLRLMVKSWREIIWPIITILTT